jgi:hypothetical protein
MVFTEVGIFSLVLKTTALPWSSIEALSPEDSR